MDREPTYDEVGATGDDELPAGYHHLRVSRVLGRGAATFERVAEDLLAWRAHERAGLRRTDGPDRATLGAAVRFRFLGLAVPCVVVAVVDEPDVRGFAYGTLPRHPESGEERFTVVRGPDEVVTAHVIAFSRPATPSMRLAGPLGRLGQRVMAGRYLRALD